MRYLGGKYYLKGKISTFLESVRKPGQEYLEPFVGGASIVSSMSGVRYASDINKYLIALYKEVQSGWIPPSNISRLEYMQAKKGDFPDYLTGFIGFGCSFGGKWFGGYASSPKQNFAEYAANSTMTKLSKCSDVTFSHANYLDLKPTGKLIYCDPPYANTTKYNGTDNFDSTLFWETMKDWSKENTVVVSEYEAPAGFKCVRKFPTKANIRTKRGREHRIERLFMRETK